MKKIVLSIAALLSMATFAYAAPMDLNYILDSTPTYDGGYSFGSVTISDNISNANRVDLKVTLANLSWKILGVYLNYNDAVLKGFRGDLMSTGGKTVGIGVNGQKAGGYSAGKFDLQDPATGNLASYGIYNDTLYGQTTTVELTGYRQKIISYEQMIVGYKGNGDPKYRNDTSKPIYGDDITKPLYSNVINNDAINLDALDFYTKDSSNSFYAAVHIGDYNNGKSIWVAAGDAPPTPVPEPGTIILLGAGLVGLAAYGRKRIQK